MTTSDDIARMVRTVMLLVFIITFVLGAMI